jgi:hypothetical protein
MCGHFIDGVREIAAFVNSIKMLVSTAWDKADLFYRKNIRSVYATRNVTKQKED